MTEKIITTNEVEPAEPKEAPKEREVLTTTDRYKIKATGRDDGSETVEHAGEIKPKGFDFSPPEPPKTRRQTRKITEVITDSNMKDIVKKYVPGPPSPKKKRRSRKKK